MKEYKAMAEAVLAPEILEYIAKTAGIGKTFKANMESFEQFRLLPRVMAGGVVSIKTSVLGKEFAMPIGIAPTAFHSLFNPEGEHATAAAALAAGVPYIISSFSTQSFGQISSDHSGNWYQMLMLKDLQLMLKYVRMAEQAGCGAIVITVDAPLGCSMCTAPTNMRPVEFPIHGLPLFPVDESLPYNTLDEYYSKYIVPMSWVDIQTIIQATSLPVVLKGILHPQDVVRAAEVGAKGIIVSNHGGRQQDGAVPSLQALSLVPQSVRNNLEVYLDGGVRTGQDVFKALALGARAVFLGRSVLYALAADGRGGVEELYNGLAKELQQTMQMCGAISLQDIVPDMLAHV